MFERNYRLLDKLLAKGRQVSFFCAVFHTSAVKCIYRGTYEGEKLAIPALVAPLEVLMSKIVFVSLATCLDQGALFPIR